MIVPIKIQCGCGQRYAFEAEIGGGQMPFTVACPVCGTDGTGAANTAIAQIPQQQPQAAATPPIAPPPPPAAAPVRLHVATTAAPPPAPAMRLHVSTPTAPAPVHTVPPATHAPGAPAPRRPLLPGQVSPEQAIVEARAKIFWGDPPEDVVKFVMMQGFNVEEASSMVREMFAERVKTLRSIGFKKLFTGIPLIFVPIVTVITCAKMAIFPSWIIALTAMAGLYGAWLALRGTILIVSPKSETCDVANE